MACNDCARAAAVDRALGRTHIDYALPDGRTALFFASTVEIAEILLKAGANPLVRLKDGRSILEASPLKDDVAFQDLILQYSTLDLGDGVK